MHIRGVQWELLQNGIKREDLELDSEIDKTGLVSALSLHRALIEPSYI